MGDFCVPRVVKHIHFAALVVLKGRKYELFFSFLKKCSLDLKSIFTNGSHSSIKGMNIGVQGLRSHPLCHLFPSPKPLKSLMSLTFPQLSSYSSCHPHPLRGSPGLAHSTGPGRLAEQLSVRAQTMHSWQELPATVNTFPLTLQECSWHSVPSQALKVNAVNYTAEQHIPDLTQGS